MPHTRGFLAAVFALVVAIAGCRRAETPQPLVVHVLYDEAAPCARQIHLSLARFNEQRGLLAGRPVIAAWYSGQYSRALNNPAILRGIDVIVVEPGSAEALALKNQLATTVKLCFGDDCREAGVPKWVIGSSREAAAKLLSFLSQNNTTPEGM